MDNKLSYSVPIYVTFEVRNCIFREGRECVVAHVVLSSLWNDFRLTLRESHAGENFN